MSIIEEALADYLSFLNGRGNKPFFLSEVIMYLIAYANGKQKPLRISIPEAQEALVMIRQRTKKQNGRWKRSLEILEKMFSKYEGSAWYIDGPLPRELDQIDFTRASTLIE